MGPKNQSKKQIGEPETIMGESQLRSREPKMNPNLEQTTNVSPISKVVHAIQLDSILRYGDFLQDIHQVLVIQHEILRQVLHELISLNIEGTKEVHQARFPLEPKEIINIVQIILL